MIRLADRLRLATRGIAEHERLSSGPRARRSHRGGRGRAFVLLLALALSACSEPEPRYGEATLSNASPRATLTGTTWGQAAALELAPGCPGYLDPTQPAHVVHVSEDIEVHLRARSDAGPLALAAARGDEVRCDSDGGDGHAPSLVVRGPGDIAVYVAALRSPGELPYTLTVSTQEDDAEPTSATDGSRDVSVTITSDPSGASVRDADGHAVGTTPTMFVVSLPPDAGPAERSWTLEHDGYHPATVSGTLSSAAVVLHAQLIPDAAEAVTEPEPVPATHDHEPAPRRAVRRPRLPELPTHASIVDVLGRLRPAIERRCARNGGTARVYFTLRGSTGSVRSVSVSGTASQQEQTCVVQAVRAARFPRFRRDSLDVDYTYDLPRRPSL